MKKDRKAPTPTPAPVPSAASPLTPTPTRPRTNPRPASVAKAVKKDGPTKPGSPKRSVREAQPRVSGLSAAATVLAKAVKPLRCQEIIDLAAKQKLWQSKGGKTPAATIHAAIIREIKTKGSLSRFRKAGRGLFAARKG